MKNRMLYLIIGIPLASVIMGMVILYAAITNPDPVVRYDGPPLNKTSFREAE
jgi:hypothetical protein